MAVKDWAEVTAAESWAFGASEAAVVSPAAPFSPKPEFQGIFPKLSALLGLARCSSVAFGGQGYLLYAWGAAGDVRAWLSPRLEIPVPEGACAAHRILLGSFGGICERYNEPDSNWLLNHNEAWVATEVPSGVSFMKDYDWAFEECGGIPIDLDAYYVVAWEANANAIICSRSSGALLFFAPDHADDDLLPYDRCPMYSLHVHRKAPDFRTWVEVIAEQWMDPTGSPAAEEVGAAS